MSNAEGPETLMQHVSRACTNCLASTFACFSTTKEKTIIAKLEYDISSRKKKFGVDYMNILERVTLEDKLEVELKECLDKAVADINKLKDEIKSHNDEVAATKEELAKKIQLGSPAKKKEETAAAAAGPVAPTPSETPPEVAPATVPIPTPVEEPAPVPAPVPDPAPTAVTTPV